MSDARPADEFTIDCFDIQLDDGENLKALYPGDTVVLDASTGHPGTWQLVEFHGETHSQATLRRVTADTKAEVAP